MFIPWIYFLKDDEQLLIEGLTKKYVVNGPKIYLSKPMEKVIKRKAITLEPTEYFLIKNSLNGHLKNILGPNLYFLDSHEEILAEREVITLKHNEYVKIIDNHSGVIRVEQGEQSFCLQPTEELMTKVTRGIPIDEHNAVLVRDTESGNLDLITTPQIFIPQPQQEIVEQRSRVILEDHQSIVIKDKHGAYHIRQGQQDERSFFLEPYSELVTFWWSSGIHKSSRELQITHIDRRPKFMWYEFEVRTHDNVELILGITFFWQVCDIQMMLNTTDDAPGDICSHARSSIIQAISKVTLEDFLADFNTIIHRAVIGNGDNQFYNERGTLIHAVEVRGITCKDEETQHILQEIIQETTNRINQLQKQESENEIKMKEIEGEIEVEKKKGDLLKHRRKHQHLAAQIEGESEASKIKSFLELLGSELDSPSKIALFNTLRKQDALATISEGSAQLYFTPADVDLSIESRKVS